jgi:hypothetical protein
MKMHSPRPSRSSGDSTKSGPSLYQAALFETDRDLIPARIADAARAIMNRVRELFAIDSDHIEKDQILDDALYALQALRNCAATGANAA